MKNDKLGFCAGLGAIVFVCGICFPTLSCVAELKKEKRITPNQSPEVGKWRRHVVTLNNSSYNGNPFMVEVDATFTHTSTGTQLTLPGYYDGSNQWKIGFMPTKLGQWTYATSSADPDLTNKTGTINCVSSGHAGLLAADPAHPDKWKYADGNHVVPIGVFISAMLDDATSQEWAMMASFVRDNELQLLNFRISEDDLAFSSARSLRMHLPRWQRLEERLEVLTEHGLGVDIMLYTDDSGKPSFAPYSTAEQLLIRYTVARLASFPVVMFNSGIDVFEYRDRTWVNWYGQQVRSLEPYGHPVSSRYTRGSGGLVMKGQTYNSLGDRNSTISNLLIAYNASDNIPAANNDNWSEDLAGNENGHTREDIRRAGWKATVAGGVAFHVRHNQTNCFGDLLTECDSYFDASMLANQLDAETWLRLINPFVQDHLGESFGEMSPVSSLADNSKKQYALADPLRSTILYWKTSAADTCDPFDHDNMEVKLTGLVDSYRANWFDPRDGALTSAGELAGGIDYSLSPPNNQTDDWVLLLIRNKMKLKLLPSPKESRIMIQLASEEDGVIYGEWSILIPEFVSSREGITPWCHTLPPQWQQCENGFVATRQLDSPKCQFTSRVTLVNDQVVAIDYTVKNLADTPLTDVEADFCFCCVAQPEFSSEDWYNRVFVQSLKVALKDGSPTIKNGIPVYEATYLLGGEKGINFPVAFNPGYAAFGTNIASLPIIMCNSKDGRKVYAGGFERCTRLSVSHGTCIHAAPWMGTIQPGKEATVRGRFYYMTGNMEDVTKRFCNDFGL